MESRAGVGDDYGEAFFLKNYHFESLDLGHRLSPGFNLAHNLTYIGMNKEELVDWGNKNMFPVGNQSISVLSESVFCCWERNYICLHQPILYGEDYDMYLGYINQG
jgi:hypothetical protein